MHQFRFASRFAALLLVVLAFAGSALADPLAASAQAEAAAGTICLTGTSFISAAPTAPLTVCQGKSKPLTLRVSTVPIYNGLVNLSTVSCALGIAPVSGLQVVNGVATLTVNATGSAGFAPGTYNCTVVVSNPSPASIPVGGCFENFVGSAATFSYTLRRANLCP